MAGYVMTVIIGNLGRDVNLRYLQDGKAVADWSMAVTRVWGSGDNKNEKTVWIKVTAWGKTAENANTLLKKGSKVLVESNWLDTSAWTNKQGEPASSLEVTCNTFQLLDRASGGGNTPSKQPPSNAEMSNDATGSPTISDLSDIPF